MVTPEGAWEDINLRFFNRWIWCDRSGCLLSAERSCAFFECWEVEGYQGERNATLLLLVLQAATNDSHFGCKKTILETEARAGPACLDK